VSAVRPPGAAPLRLKDERQAPDLTCVMIEKQSSITEIRIN